MFYYLLYNSSFSFIVENRLFSTILYGSILYIVTHAVLNYCDISILNIVNNYYWTLFTLDIISFVYAFYQSITDNNNNSHNELNVSFNLLKNKINTILDRKNDLTVTHSTVLNKNNSNSNSNSNNNNNNNSNSSNSSNSNSNTQSKQKNINTIPLQSSNKFSTPISQLQNINQGSSSNQSSTPISLIRNANIIEPNIDMQDDQFNQYAESNTGSDLGSVMDLDDFETSL